MNTPAHSILNLAILGRAQQPMLNWPILLGSWLPDAALFVFYAWAKLLSIPESIIWREAYYDPVWQDIFAIGNSIPLAVLGLGIFIAQKRLGWVALFASMLLHQLADLPLHHDDAHRHFWPFSDYRFTSPVSYWDRDHYGSYGALVETGLLVIASVFLLRRTRSRWGQSVILLINLAYLYGYYRLYLKGEF
jgi:hypothetical protein